MEALDRNLILYHRDLINSPLNSWEYSCAGSKSVEALVNILGDALDLGVQLIFYLKQVLLVILSHEVDAHTEMTESTRSSNSVQIGLSILGEIEVDNNVHGLDVNSSGEDISAYKASGFSIFEVVENPIK